MLPLICSIAAVLVTLYQKNMPYSFTGLRNALSAELENVDEECSVNLTVTDVWRFGKRNYN